MNTIKTLIAVSILAGTASVYAALDLYDRAESLLSEHVKPGTWRKVSPCFVVDSRIESDVYYAVEDESGQVEFRSR